MTFTDVAYYQEKFSKLKSSNEIIKSREFEECDFTGCSFISCTFEKCKFLNCKFNDCILSAVIPMDCRFLDVKFYKCKVIGMDWTKTQKIQKLDFNECQINYSNFRFLKIPGTVIIKSESKDTDFTEADLHDGDFKNTDFERSRFLKLTYPTPTLREPQIIQLTQLITYLRKPAFLYLRRYPY